MIDRRKFYQWFNYLAGVWFIIMEISLSADCLKDLKIFVPEAVIMGNAATLSCQYDLEQKINSNWNVNAS
uniref:Ig-like domain-containing protein n=1 Tax=Glossina palpalis gambiensis TaxID=67801 RepID=A0A1B0BIZ5_9MUSC